MASDEIDGERVLPAGTMTSDEAQAPSGFVRDARDVVDHHLARLLGGPALPVHHAAPGEDAPYLTALDAHGEVVAVEVVTTLDDAALLAVLGRAGRLGAMPRADVLATYDAGLDALVVDHARFVAAIPGPAAAPVGRTDRVRLVIVCRSVEQRTLDAVRFLRQPGRDVDVLRLSVGRAADGRRTVDVSLLAHDDRPPRAAASATASAAARPAEAAPAAPAGAALARALLGTASRAAAVPAAPVAAHPEVAAAGEPAVAAPAQPVEPAPARPPAAPSVQAPAPTSPATAAPAAAGYLAEPDLPPLPVEDVPALLGTGHGAAEAARHGAVADPVAPVVLGTARRRAVRAASAQDTGPSTHAAAFRGARPRRWVASVEETSIDTHENDLSALRESSLSFAAAMAYGDVQPPPRHRTRAAVPHGVRDRDLTFLAASLGGPTPLVWVRHRRGERHEATLLSDGIVEVADGRRFYSPDAAAVAASGSDQPVDGWRTWHLGDPDGPTLAEARDAQA